MSPKLCAKFGFDLEQATVICCILEFFFAYVHVLVATCVVSLAPMRYYDICFNSDYDTYRKNDPNNHPGLSFVQVIMWLTYIVYLLGLYIQAAFSIPLYHIGCKKKNIRIIQWWLIIAGINYLCPAVLLICSFIAIDLGGAGYTSQKTDPKDIPPWAGVSGGIPKQTGFIFFYMFYLDIGFAVFWAYRKHLIKQGQIVAPESVLDMVKDTLGMKTESSAVQVLSDDQV